MSTISLCALRTTYSKSRYLRAALYSSLPKNIPEQKLGKVVNVAIIGAPNAGKSTLINKILDRKICAVSSKVHTTTKLIRAMSFENDTQIVFLDTPGVVTDKEKKKYKLPDYMTAACHKSLRCANVVGVIHDVGNRYTRDSIHPEVIQMLEMVENTPSFLIMNKVDKLNNKRQLLSTIRNLTNGIIAGNPMPGLRTEKPKFHKGYSKFSDVFLTSALNGDGVQDIKEYLISNAKPANFQYSPDKWTDQSPESLIEDVVRAKFLDFLAQEIPYTLTVELEYYEEIEMENKIICSVIVQCPSERLVKLISGAGGGRLQQIKSHIRTDLVELFKKLVVFDLKLSIKSKPTEYI